MTLELDQFLGLFLQEAQENLDAVEEGLLRLEMDPRDGGVINDVFRAVHTLKGNAATFGFTDLVGEAHRMETVLHSVRVGEHHLQPADVNELLQGLDSLRNALQIRQGAAPAPAQKPPPPGGWAVSFRPHAGLLASGNDPVLMFRSLAQLGPLKARADLSALPALRAMQPDRAYLAWDLELAASPLDLVQEVFEWVEDQCDLTISPLQEKPAVTRRPSEPAEETEAYLRVEASKLDALLNLVGELSVLQAALAARQPGDELIEAISQQIRQVQYGVLHTRMLPVAFAYQRLPRLVRDLAQKLGKQADLKLAGETVELDKAVLEKLTDPLVHLVRNCLDHGLERPELRRQLGKPATGTLTVSASTQGGGVLIEVADDGGGVDLAAVAARSGLPLDTPREQLLDQLFEPGFSTALGVSEVSGRGVGLDVVRRNLRSLGGAVWAETTAGQGTRFLLKLPLTLAVLEGQVVRVGCDRYLIPLLSIVETVPVEPGRVHSACGRPQYAYREGYVPMLGLADALEGRTGEASAPLLVIVETAGRLLGLLVDEVLDLKQVVVKSLEKNFRRLQGLLGAAIAEDGRVLPIVDVTGLAA